MEIESKVIFIILKNNDEQMKNNRGITKNPLDRSGN